MLPHTTVIHTLPSIKTPTPLFSYLNNKEGSQPMEYYMDEKWKARGKDKTSSSSKSKPPSLPRSISTKSPHQSNSSASSSTLSRSSSLKTAASSVKSSFPRSSSQKCADFTQKCSSIAKEQKARFYIVKRCICMLVGLKKDGDS